jgi:arsenate reductase-like glutaredoxin family protein
VGALPRDGAEKTVCSRRVHWLFVSSDKPEGGDCVSKLDWMYHRKNCKTCQKTDAYLDEHGLSINQTVDCKKEPMTFSQAKALLAGVKTLYATKGTKTVEVDLTKGADEELLESLLIGPSGNLRAPTIKTGDVMVVGYDQALYSKAFGGKQKK